jgi:hypothetical protein
MNVDYRYRPLPEPNFDILRKRPLMDGAIGAPGRVALVQRAGTATTSGGSTFTPVHPE